MRLPHRLVRACLASPARMAATVALITPGMHLMLSTFVERRRVTWASDYPAVLVGDPLLALATGVAAEVAGVDAVLRAVPMRRPFGPLVMGTAAVYGAWQVRDEVRRGIYTRQQAHSPSKLWHQFVVYPTLSPLVAGALIAATATALRRDADRCQRRRVALAWAATATWAALAVEARSHPRQGHGTADWSRLRQVARWRWSGGPR